MAVWFADQLKPVISQHKNVQRLTIRVYETQSARAEYSIEL